MSEYKCQCGVILSSWDDALKHHNQITGHNIYTNLSKDPCPSCAALRARVAVLEKVVEKYSRHGIHATWCYKQGIKCACGLEELRAALDALKEG